MVYLDTSFIAPLFIRAVNVHLEGHYECDTA